MSTQFTSLTVLICPSCKQRKHGRSEFDGYAVQSTQRIEVSGSISWVSSLRNKSFFSLCCVSSLPGHLLCTLRYLLIPVATGRAVGLHRGTQDCTSRDKVLSAALRKIMYGILYCFVGWIVPNSGNISADSNLPQRANFFKMSLLFCVPHWAACMFMEDSNVLLRSYRIITTTYCSVRMCVSCVSLFITQKRFKYLLIFCVMNCFFNWVKFRFTL